MPSVVVNVSVSSGDVNIQAIKTPEDAGKEVAQDTIPHGFAGVLTTRTSNTAGIVTVDSGHGITAADFVTIYSDGARLVAGNVSAVDATTITFAGGMGDALPLVNAEVVISVEKRFVGTIDGDNLNIIASQLSFVAGTVGGAGMARFGGTDNLTESDILIEDYGDSEVHLVDVANGQSNPYSGNVIHEWHVSNAHPTVDAAAFKLIALYNATP